MQRQPGYQFLRRPDDTHVLDNDSVHTRVMQKDQIIFQFRQLLIIHQRIHRHVQTNVMHMAEIHSFRHFLPVKIAGIGPGTKRFSA